jgi:integrase
MTKQGMYDRIRARTGEAYGTPINPHLFRDIAATTLAVAAPQHVRLAAPLLSHTNLATTERCYLQASGLEASARYQAQVLSLRRATRGW